MAKLTDNTLVLKDGAPVSLLKGEEVPDWAKDQVGDHLLEGAEDKKDEAPKGNASREAWASYAKDKKGAPDEETRPVEEGGLTQAQLRDKYAK